MTYIPNEEDLQWARITLQMVREDGVISFNGTLLYRVSHKNRTLTLLNPELLLDYKMLRVHMRTVTVFAFVSYRVSEESVITRVAMLFDTHIASCKECQDPIELCPHGMKLLEHFYEAVLSELVFEDTEENKKHRKEKTNGKKDD
jgi:hypothetical protein